MTSVNSLAYLTVVKYLNIWLKNSMFGWIYLKVVLIVFERALATALYLTGQDKAIKNCSPDHDRGGVKIQKKVRIAYSEFSHLWADHLAGPSNISYA